MIKNILHKIFSNKNIKRNKMLSILKNYLQGPLLRDLCNKLSLNNMMRLVTKL